MSWRLSCSKSSAHPGRRRTRRATRPTRSAGAGLVIAERGQGIVSERVLGGKRCGLQLASPGLTPAASPAAPRARADLKQGQSRSAAHTTATGMSLRGRGRRPVGRRAADRGIRGNRDELAVPAATGAGSPQPTLGAPAPRVAVPTKCVSGGTSPSDVPLHGCGTCLHLTAPRLILASDRLKHLAGELQQPPAHTLKLLGRQPRHRAHPDVPRRRRYRGRDAPAESRSLP
jgi:hypothetical protein